MLRKLVQRSALKASVRHNTFPSEDLGTVMHCSIVNPQSLIPPKSLADENILAEQHVILSTLSKEEQVQFDQDVKDDDVNIVGSFVSIC